MLPETSTGFQLSSNKIDDLSLEAGHFTAFNNRNLTNSDDMLLTTFGGTEEDSVDFIGGTYKISEKLSVKAYTSKAVNVWRQHFGSASYTIPLTDQQSLSFGLTAYKTQDQGEARAGKLDTTSWSAKVAYSFDAHKFTLAYQKIAGDEYFDYIGVDSVWLANSIQYSDFNAPNERSIQARYDLNLATFGIPGLSFMAPYVKGDQIDGTKAHPNGAYVNKVGDDQKEWERDLEAKYVIQEGTAKDLSFRLRQAIHRATSFESDIDEVRLIIEYLLSIL
ncbi:OprD family outer membrane porin [Pseudomonas sp. MM213]|uniref:OprD family outer membrane porin n=1 Tax=Pseudomonas sp. MM213 TaxID=2866807 RepID=UPI0022A757B6|nr:OprD family outer membrane porin [Pseudomonas sp. MM213]